MANKFQQSVLQRQEDDAKRAQAAPVAPDPVQDQPPAPPAPDVGAYLRQAPQRRARNKTFYLDTDVIDALQKAAKAQKVTDSKLCGDILRGVLGL